jgi:hypothetical protein
MKVFKAWFSVVVVLLLSASVLSGCGGGGGGGAAAPAAPIAVTADAGNGQVTINWSPVAGATSYNVYQGTAATITKATGTKVGFNITASPFIATGLTNGTTYYFLVTAVNAAGESAASVVRSATPSATPPPAAPVNIRGAAGNGTATISWDPSVGATSYNIYYSTTTGVTKASVTNVIGAVSPQLVTGLTNGTTYFFVVTALNANGESAESFEVSVTPSATPLPAAPTGVTATAGNGQATVSWTAVAGATSYNIYYAASTGVTKATGIKVAGAASPQVITGLTNNTTYFFVVTAVNANGESAESSQVSATPVAPPVANFTQADLVGTWNFVQLTSGPDVVAGTEPGWIRGNITINATGSVTVNSISSSDNSVVIPAAGTITETITANGVITEGGVNGSAVGNQAVMAANKLIAVGTTTSGVASRSLRIFVKQVATFSNADISSVSFVASELSTGAINGWDFAAGTVNAAQQITITSDLTDVGVGTPPPANSITLAITSTGIVTTSGVNGNATFQGVMTPDKKLIIGTETEGTSYRLRIIAIAGQTFTTADLAGTWSDHAITSELAPVWEYSTIFFNSAGVGTTLAFLDSTGSTAVGVPFSLSIGPTGLITQASDPSLHGVMAFNKNFIVVTDTRSAGVFSMDILVK